MTGDAGGFDGLAGAGGQASDPTTNTGLVPPGIRTVGPDPSGATRIVLIRHGEAVCNVSGVCGGPIGCQGLTDLGRRQVTLLRDRLVLTGELAGVDALYASVLPRAVETAELLAPALAPVDAEGPTGKPPRPVLECGLCELHPGEADGLSWSEFTQRFGTLDWDVEPRRPIAPGGESWAGFVNRVADMLDTLAARHPGQRVVVAGHAGVIEASLLAKIPVVGGLDGARLQLRTRHASLTSWEVDGHHWRLLAYNDASHLAALDVAG
jgi:probable phosphoglycerate mutase